MNAGSADGHLAASNPGAAASADNIPSSFLRAVYFSVLSLSE